MSTTLGLRVSTSADRAEIRAQRRTPRSSPLLLGLGLLVVALVTLMTVRDGVIPSAGLDPSWQQAVEFARRQHLVFGRDVVFTYGPYAYIATRLFDPSTFPQVLFYDLFVVGAVCWTALRNRSAAALVALALIFVLPPYSSDGPFSIAAFGVFLILLHRRDRLGLAMLALFAPLLLAKYSFALALAPLVVLADLHRLLGRKAPLCTPTLVIAVLAADLVAGQPLSVLPALAVNTLTVVLGYGRAMQVKGPTLELGGALLLALALAGFGALLAWRAGNRIQEEGEPAAVDERWAPAFAALGFAWTLFIAFKMGFVRQDSHTIYFHEIAPAALALLFAFVDRPHTPERGLAPVFGLLLLIVLSWSVYWHSEDLRPIEGKPPSVSGYLGETLAGLGPRMRNAGALLTGRREPQLATLRTASLRQMRRAFTDRIRGSVDAAPTELAELIASGLDYRPRPMIQSYSAYTPRLQALDHAHFAGSGAPDTLLLKIEDIDARLPTLGLGPSLPVIGERYDPVGRDTLGLVLRRRSAPRPVSAQTGPVQTVALGQWSPAPGRPGRLVMAHVNVRRSLLGRLAGFLYREPMMMIQLRAAGGGVVEYRFVPDMAQLGVAISPLPANWDQVGVLFDPSVAADGATVTAIKLDSHAAWAFSGVTVQYEEITFPPGFNALMPPPALDPQLASALEALGVSAGANGAPVHGGAVLAASRVGPQAGLCRGWFDALNVLQPGSSVVEVSGWGWDEQVGRIFQRIVVTDATGRVVGVALGGVSRPDVTAAVKQVRSTASGWKGVAVSGGARELVAYGLLADGRACEIGRISAAR